MPRHLSGSWINRYLLTAAFSTVMCACAALHADESDAVDSPGAVTFFAVSDPHYQASPYDWPAPAIRRVVRQMNEIPGSPWPDSLDGGEITEPRGVMMLGDIIDHGDRGAYSAASWAQFAADFGLTKTDGRLKFAVFEGWGNHDGPPVGEEKNGFSMQRQLKRRNQHRLELGLISRVSDNGLHYSWDWGDVHLVMTNHYPADKQHKKVRYNPVWHDPQDALGFLKEDLKECVGDSGRPVVILAHCGFDTDWWPPEQWAEFYHSVEPYNVVLYMHGHTGTKVYQWRPEGDHRAPLNVVNTGQAHDNFFVVEIRDDSLRVANRSYDHEEKTWSWGMERRWPIGTN